MDYPNHLWCTRKHAMLIGVHSGELISKVERDCVTGVCDWSPATREKADAIVSHLLATEEHIQEVIQKGGDKGGELGGLADGIRDIRQEIVQTGIVFGPQSGVKPAPNTKEVLYGIGGRIRDFKSDLDSMASRMKQDQVDCNSCNEDLTSLKERISGSLTVEVEAVAESVSQT